MYIYTHNIIYMYIYIIYTICTSVYTYTHLSIQTHVLASAAAVNLAPVLGVLLRNSHRRSWRSSSQHLY